MKPTNNEPKEFYEHTTKVDPNICDHTFTRLSATRVLCKRCGLGFFDNPLDPFPVEEINKLIKKEKKEKRVIEKNA
jgi:hypothetical protein